MFIFAATAEPQVRIWNLLDSVFLPKATTEFLYGLTYFIGLMLCILVPYLLGSINPAVLISKIFYHEDIRNFGSGNAGSTNMLRTYGKKAALATFLCDLAKAALAVEFGRLVWEYNGMAIAGFFVVFGHMFPIFAKFKGGKGVACLSMVVLLTSPITFAVLLGIFLIVVIGTKYISLGSVMAALFYPLILNAFTDESYGLCVAMAVLTTCFVVFMHRSNLKRLWEGKESKVSFSKLSKKKKDDADTTAKPEEKESAPAEEEEKHE